MILWNLEHPDQLKELVGRQGADLRKTLRIARYDGKKLEYLQPILVRMGWIGNGSYVIDARASGRHFGASDPLRPIPDGVIVLIREGRPQS